MDYAEPNFHLGLNSPLLPYDQKLIRLFKIRTFCLTRKGKHFFFPPLFYIRITETKKKKKEVKTSVINYLAVREASL